MAFEKRGLVALGLLLFVLIAFVGSVSADDWPMFQSNPQHTGYQNETISTRSLSLLWNFTNTEGGIFSFPLTISGGVLYSPDMIYLTFFAINSTTGAQIWNESAISGSYTLASAVSDGVIYVMESRLFALNATTGVQIWNETNASIFTLSEISPTIVNGVIYTYGSYSSGNTYTDLVAINATTGSFMWNYSTDINSGSPVYDGKGSYDGGVIYTLAGASSRSLYAINTTTHSLIWNYSQTGSSYYGFHILVGDGIVYSGGTSVFAINATNGTQLWNYTPSGKTFDSSSMNIPSFANGIFYISDNANDIYAFNATNGSIMWNKSIGSSFSSSVSNGVVWVGSSSGAILAFNATTGNQVWSYTLGNGTGASPPTIANGMVYVGDAGGVIYAFGVPPATSCDSVSSCNAAIAAASTGDIVRMNQSITVTQNGTAIDMGKNGVTFDCAGYSLTGPGKSNSSNYGVYLSNVFSSTVKNCNINNFYDGVYFDGGSNNNLLNSTIVSNNNGAILYYAFNSSIFNNTMGSQVEGVQLYVSSGGLISDNKFVNFSGYVVDFSGYSNTTRVLNNTFLNLTTASSAGIYVDSSFSNVLGGNTFTNSSNYGISLSSSSYNNTIINNTLINSTQAGIYVYSSSNNTIKDNNVTISPNYGISLYSSTNNSIKNNSVSLNTLSGIYVYYSSNNTITENTAYSNSNNAVQISHGSNNTIADNILNSNGAGINFYFASNDTAFGNIMELNTNYGLYAYASNYNLVYDNLFNNSINFYNNSASLINYFNTTLTFETNVVSGNYIGGNLWAWPNGTGFSDTCTDNNIKGVCDSSYTLKDGVSIDNYPLKSYPITQCSDLTSCTNALSAASPGDIIKLNTSITGLTSSSLVFSSSTDNITFDCDGHWINGTNSGTDGLLVNSGSQYNTIKNCYIGGNFYRGIESYDIGNAFINDHIINSSYANIAIYSNNNTVFGCTATKSRYSAGVTFSSSFNSIIDSNFSHNLYGIQVAFYSITNNTFRGNNMSGNLNNLKLDVNPGSISGNRFGPSNIVDYNKRVYYNYSVSNYVFNQTSIPDAGVVYCISCNNVTYKNLNLSHHNYYGLYFMSTNNSHIENVTSNNNSMGIAFNYPRYENLTLDKITANYNKVSGVYLNAQAGGSRNVSLSNVVANSNKGGSTYAGIFVGPFWTRLVNITSNSNVAYGILFGSSSYQNSLRNAVLKNNTYSGIYFSNSHNNNITNATIADSVGATFYFSQFENNSWESITYHHFPIKYETVNFSISPVNNQIKLRIKHNDTKFGDVDQLRLNACGINITPDYAIYTDNNESVLNDILKVDNNATSMENRTLEISWTIPSNCTEQPLLFMTANEYDSSPFYFRSPMQGYVPFNQTFPPSVLQNITIDGNINEVDGVISPDYEVYWQPATGHPDGWTYVYTGEDSNNLYFMLDITPDNTNDAEDWAKVLINTSSGTKVFEINSTFDKYGKCGFGLTSKVDYNHATCEFAIPLTDVGTGNLSYAIEYYGTTASAPFGTGIYFSGSSSSNIINDSRIVNNTYGLVFLASYSTGSTNNLIYNNVFNNTINVYDTASVSNMFNTTLGTGTNIAGGSKIGGNLWENWSNPGSGFSLTCTDANSDGICDSQYNLTDGINFDYFPLKYTYPVSNPTNPPSGTPSGSSNGGSTVGGTTTTTGGVFGGTTSSAIFTNITAGTPVTVYTNSSGVPLTSLTITTNQTVNNASINTSAISTILFTNMKISTSSSLWTGITYQSFRISTQNINDSVITNVVMNFTVNTSWIVSNNVNPSSIKLYRNTGGGLFGTWTALPTTLVSNNSQYYYFSSISPGFSDYTIAGEMPKKNGGGFLNAITPSFFKQSTFGLIVYYLLLIMVIGGIVVVSYSLYKRTLWINFHRIWRDINKKRR